MLKYAVKWGYLGMNPAAEVKAPRVESEEMDALTPEEVRHLLTGVSEEDGEPLIKPGWYVPIKLAIFSGLRQGEQFALRLGDLDFHSGQVRVRRTLTWYQKRHAKGEIRYVFASPKTKNAVRNVDLSPDMLEDLRRYVAGFPDQDPDRLLFPSAVGTPLDPKNVGDRVFKKALTRAKFRALRWHDLRHTYASLQLASGANIKQVREPENGSRLGANYFGPLQSLATGQSPGAGGAAVEPRVCATPWLPRSDTYRATKGSGFC